MKRDILMNLVQIGLTVSLAALVPLILRRVLKKRYPARVICAVWAILALRLLVPVQLSLPEAPVQLAPRTNYVVHTDAQVFAQAGLPLAQASDRWVTNEQAAALGAADTGSMTTVDVTGILLALWIAGAAVCVLRQAVGYGLFMKKLRRTAKNTENTALQAAFEEQERDLGITRDIPLRIAPAADCPMLAGFVRPALYLPDEALSDADAAFIFRHELTHFKRGDLWLKLLLTAAVCVHWFNPLVHLIARFAQEDIELACDDAVVHGMDGAARRAYGEVILRSAAAQARRQRALVSCFAGDKKTLLRRFEGLFDKRAKKRGAALIALVAVLIVSLGCAVSVGGNGLTDAKRLELAEAYAQQSDPLAYTVKLDGRDTYVISEVEFSDSAEETIPARVAIKLTFAKTDGEWAVSGEELAVPDGVRSLADFKLLYENDLGLPDFLSGRDNWTIASGYDLTDPSAAAQALLRLDPEQASEAVSVSDESPDKDIHDVTFTFADGSELTVTMVNQYGEAWLPQDWTDGEGQNARTAADLARQYARGALHQSAQFVYPIMGDAARETLTAQQYGMTGGTQWSWKFGPSSPSAREYAVVPADDKDAYNVIFRETGGGVNDYREGFTIHTAMENGRRVISETVPCGTDNYTQSDLFNLYYTTGLAWPQPDDSWFGLAGDRSRLDDPAAAAEFAFGYFGENVTTKTENGTNIAFHSWLTAQTLSQSGDAATVRLSFTDESTPVEIELRKSAAGWWQPVGLAGSADTSTGELELTMQREGKAAVLPVFGSAEMAAINPYDATLGETLTIRPAQTPDDGKVTVRDRLVHSDGSPEFDDRVTQETTLGVSSGAAFYALSVNTASLLRSNLVTTEYRALTVSYVSGGKTYQSVVVLRFRDNSSTETALTSTTYQESDYGYTLTFPEELVGKCYVEWNTTFGGLSVYMTDGVYGDTAPTLDGLLMTVISAPTALMRERYGDDWTANYGAPCKELAEHEGLTYFVQYPPDTEYSAPNGAQYEALRKAADVSISFDGQTDAQHQAERQNLLGTLGLSYVSDCTTGEFPQMASFIGDTADNSVVASWQTAAGGDGTTAPLVITHAQRLWFADIYSAAPSRVQDLGASDQKGMDGALFRAFYTEGLPIYDENQIDMLETLQFKEEVDLSTPEKGAAYALGLGEALGKFVPLSSSVKQELARQYGFDEGSPQADLMLVQYEFNDGTTAYIRMEMHGGDDRNVYLPSGCIITGSGDTVSVGATHAWDTSVYERRNMEDVDHYSDRTTAELLFYLPISDGAYTEGILATLDARYREDKTAFEQALHAADSTAQSLWAQHLAAQ